MCREYELFDPFEQQHGSFNLKSYLRGSHSLDYIFCTFNNLKAAKYCGMIGFNELIKFRSSRVFPIYTAGYGTKRQECRKIFTILKQIAIQISKSIKNI